MLLVISDDYGKEYKYIVSDLAAIPSIGHRINLGYNPAPRVVEVIWNYEGELIPTIDHKTQVLIKVE